MAADRFSPRFRYVQFPVIPLRLIIGNNYILRTRERVTEIIFTSPWLIIPRKMQSTAFLWYPDVLPIESLAESAAVVQCDNISAKWVYRIQYVQYSRTFTFPVAVTRFRGICWGWCVKERRTYSTYVATYNIIHKFLLLKASSTVLNCSVF